MRGVKTIDFDFDITYSVDGTFATTRQITVREPGLKNYDAHARMSAYVGNAMIGFTKAFASVSVPAGQDAPADGDTSDEQDVMKLMSMGLDIEEFPKFATYVKKLLTGAPRFAFVGGNESCPITDEVWESLYENGGMAAVDKVMGEFTGFFVNDKPQDKPNGVATAPISALPTKAHSPTARRPTSRLPS